jgi:peroxiredoxin
MKTVRFSRRKHGARLGLLRLALGIGVVAALGAGIFRTSLPTVRSQGNDASFESEVQNATNLLRRRRYEDALKSFKRANDMRDKKSAECFFGMAEAYLGLEAYKSAVDSCEKIIELAGSDTQLQAQAYNLEGIALQTQAGVKDQKKLQEAEAVLRKGLALATDLPVLHFNLGYTLMELGRDAEGIVELKKYSELQPDGPKAEQARKLIENPRRAREAYAPDFSITTADGKDIALKDLRGKIVLLDFWGTWCPPCVASVPSLRDLHKRFAKESSFVMIGIGDDSNEEKWRDFTGRNQMDWIQYLDRDRHVVRAFDVHTFPTYVLIDAEGVVRFRSVGTSWERTGDLPDAIRKQIKTVARTGP